ncbi:DUF2684 domain-containing protein [Citrobacter amalonaticus]|uniref:DUF2684 domain-containing protein n=1 Tax=Citrobacter amalonaticus TaxID=35703 RepID=A0A2S4RTS9_CITAM|nr:DUF2684 domain-containing protein [Citrobacter amalonaticus]POT72064.1 DUF2684 domain-containing protein [Citrobacter amalonaticus]POU63203.1 DUF2684 domain-containing protein [Citrobacter amalonaticus]POV04852.1 DUF2684 domain-containing protein [Citrobacter amalonaticus]
MDRRFYHESAGDCDTGSLSVNQYGWINIWTAILGHFFTQFPVFFESALTGVQTSVEIFPNTAGNVCIYVLLFSQVIGIKRGARLILKKHTTMSSCRHFQPG